LSHVELVLAMNGTGRQEHMNAVLGRIAQRLGRELDVFEVATGKSTDRRALHLARHRVDRLPIAARGGRKSSFDHINTQLGKRARHTKLLWLRHAASRRLLAIAQRGVEDQYPVWIGSHGSGPYLDKGAHQARRSFNQGIRARSSAPTFSIWR